MDPFTIDISDEVIADLHHRLEITRFPDQLDGAAWDYGTELTYLRDLCDYWRYEYNWHVWEDALNRFDHFTADANGLNVHFIHQRSPEAHAFPLILTHGWPGSFAEFTKIIGPLSDPAAYGGDAADAFHVVCPSMPGYGFSERPTQPGFDIKAVAETNMALMATLGYDRYGAQGGDWGSLATSWMGYLDSARVAGIHLNMPVASRPKDGEALQKLTQAEAEKLERARDFRKYETGYQQIQGTKPQSLGYGLNDSPAGLAAWIVEKFRTWSDCDGDVESRFTKDELLTNITIYWVTETITSSMRLYYESMKSGRFGPVDGYVDTPTACACFPKEIYLPPRAWVENHYNVTRWTEFESGGHFAAMEEPEALVDDIRSFFRDYR